MYLCNCVAALGALANMSQIETTISNFLVPLQVCVCVMYFLLYNFFVVKIYIIGIG